MPFNIWQINSLSAKKILFFANTKNLQEAEQSIPARSCMYTSTQNILITKHISYKTYQKAKQHQLQNMSKKIKHISYKTYQPQLENIKIVAVIYMFCILMFFI